MSLRLMQLSDHPQLEPLWQAEHMVSDYAYLQAVLEWNPSSCWVIEQDGQIIAAACGLYNGRHGILSSVVVHPSQRGQGYGAQIVQATIASLQALGKPRIRLFVAKTNEQVLPFYEHLGFYLKEDAHYMGWGD
jgi:ribosomal protein S18 acetylase RimI-like enzyme